MNTRNALILSLTAVLLCACSSDGGPPVETVDRTLISSLDSAELESVLETYKGRVVLVNMWATWCAPCLKEIPELVELEQNLEADGFTVLGISLDDVDARDDVLSFRDQWFPEFHTYHTSESDWFALVGAIKEDWNSLLPTSFVLDRNGELVETLTGSKDYATFAAAVAPYL